MQKSRSNKTDGKLGLRTNGNSATLHDHRSPHSAALLKWSIDLPLGHLTCGPHQGKSGSPIFYLAATQIVSIRQHNFDKGSVFLWLSTSTP